MEQQQRFSYWLAQACGAARASVDKSLGDAAAVARLDKSTIHRFENDGIWPRNPEAVIAAYAVLVDMADSRDLWEIAFRLWREYGEAPVVQAVPRESVSAKQIAAAAIARANAN